MWCKAWLCMTRRGEPRRGRVRFGVAWFGTLKESGEVWRAMAGSGADGNGPPWSGLDGRSTFRCG